MRYDNVDEAVLAFSRKSGDLLTPTILKAAWLRAVDANESPIQRLIELCELADECRDGVTVDAIGHADLDLLPFSCWRTP